MIDPEHVFAPSAGIFAAEQLRRELAEVKAVNRKQHERMMNLLWMNLDLQDINDGLKAENERLKELVKLHMAADLARADLDRD